MESFQLIRPYFAENRSRILIGMICLTLVDFLQVCIPRVLKLAVDDVTGMRTDPEGLIVYALVIVAIALVIGGFRYVWRRCLIGTSRRVEEGLRNRLFSHLQTLSASYFDGVKTGDLMAHATNDIQNIRMATGMGIVALTDAMVLGTAAISFMMATNVRLTLLVLTPAPLIVLGTRIFGKLLHERFQTVQKSFADLTEIVRERFAGIRIIQAYTREKESAAAVESMSLKYVQENLRLVKVTRSLFPMMMFFSNLSMVIVLLVGGRLTIAETITPGDFVAFIGYLGLLTWPMMAMGWVTTLIQRGKASIDRINAILSEEPAITNRDTHATGTSPGFGDLVVDKAGFSYGKKPSGEKAAPLKPVDSAAVSGVFLTLPKGKTLGITGPPGSGKSTLLKFLPRIYDTGEGSVSLGGVDIRDWPLASLRRHFAYVAQEPFLFAGTIRENITFDNPHITEDRLHDAVKKASLDKTIGKFPKGFETVVGEKGIILSGGQKQRIALARAFLKDAPLLLLDDPISQVDAETGKNIMDAIATMAKEKTVAVVSHRISAIRFADWIIVMEEGRIIAEGNHEQLMERGGYYANAFRLQQIEEAFNGAS